MSKMNPFNVLGLHPNCSIQDLKKKFRQLASIYHPDRGGSPEEFIKYRIAYKLAEKILKKPVKCPFCDGSGFVVTLLGNGFGTNTEECSKCDSKGEIIRDE